MNPLQTLIAQHKTIVFDLDGTLMHTEPDIRLAANQALKDCGFEPLSPTCVIPNLFGPLYDILGSIMSVVDAPAVAADDMMQAYLKHYADQGHDNSFLYPGVRTLLDQLRDQGCALGVCTNKIELSAKQALERRGVLSYFSVVTGGDSTAQPKPHAMPLLHTLESLSASSQEAILIGDTHVDALCASNCGVSFIFHQGGYGGDLVDQYQISARFQSYLELCR